MLQLRLFIASQHAMRTARNVFSRSSFSCPVTVFAVLCIAAALAALNAAVAQAALKSNKNAVIAEEISCMGQVLQISSNFAQTQTSESMNGSHPTMKNGCIMRSESIESMQPVLQNDISAAHMDDVPENSNPRDQDSDSQSGNILII